MANCVWHFSWKIHWKAVIPLKYNIYFSFQLEDELKSIAVLRHKINTLQDSGRRRGQISQKDCFWMVIFFLFRCFGIFRTVTKTPSGLVLFSLFVCSNFSMSVVFPLQFSSCWSPSVPGPLLVFKLRTSVGVVQVTPRTNRSHLEGWFTGLAGEKALQSLGKRVGVHVELFFFLSLYGQKLDVLSASRHVLSFVCLSVPHVCVWCFSCVDLQSALFLHVRGSVCHCVCLSVCVCVCLCVCVSVCLHACVSALSFGIQYLCFLYLQLFLSRSACCVWACRENQLGFCFSFHGQVPIFNKKDEIFQHLCEFEVPLMRAVWFIKVGTWDTVV